MAAVIYSATMFSDPELRILDFDLVPLHGRLFRDIDARARELADICRAHGRVTFVPESLKRHADAAGILSEMIPVEMEPETLLMSAAHHTSRGAVKLCDPALAKTRRAPFEGAMDFRLGRRLHMDSPAHPDLGRVLINPVLSVPLIKSPLRSESDRIGALPRIDAMRQERTFERTKGNVPIGPTRDGPVTGARVPLRPLIWKASFG
jgi:hypothetical protein